MTRLIPGWNGLSITLKTVAAAGWDEARREDTPVTKRTQGSHG